MEIFFSQLFSSLGKQEESSDDEAEEGEVEDEHPSDVEVSIERVNTIMEVCL